MCVPVCLRSQLTCRYCKPRKLLLLKFRNNVIKLNIVKVLHPSSTEVVTNFC
jgi:hypothetical protein